MSASNARAVFVSMFIRLIEDSAVTTEIYKHKCSSGCTIHIKLNQIAIATFNIKARNFTTEENDEIRASNRKKRVSDPKESAISRKIKKLSGQ